MKKIMIAAFLLSTSLAYAGRQFTDAELEEDCHEQQVQYFDGLVQDCPRNKRMGNLTLNCVIFTDFKPTKPIPNMAAYRQVFIDGGTATCVANSRWLGRMKE
jgi:hypothetical protein